MAKINNAVRVIEFENEEQFYYKIENDLISYMGDPDARCYYSIQEISLINELGYITINDMEYEIEEIKYVVDEYGVRYAEIYLN